MLLMNRTYTSYTLVAKIKYQQDLKSNNTVIFLVKKNVGFVVNSKCE